MLPETLKLRPQALLLDAGDTLLFMDYAALSEALKKLGEDVAEAQLERSMPVAKSAYQTVVREKAQHEHGWYVLMRSLLLEAGVKPERAEGLLQPLRAIHEDFYFWRSVPPEVPQALELARKAGIRLGVVSNSEGRLQSVLERVGLLPYFDVVVDSHLEGVAKPDPEIFKIALWRMNVAAEHAMYAGDLPEIDLVGAAAAGMHGALVDALDSYHARPDLPRVESVAQLVDELLRLPSSATPAT
jgi:putative hydrolase of the HAD superfamily